MKETIISIFFLFTYISTVCQCIISDDIAQGKSIILLNDLLNSLSEFNSKYNTNKHIEHICDAIEYLNNSNNEKAIASIILHSEQHIEKSEELYKSNYKGTYRDDFKNRLFTIIKKIDSISFVSLELAYNKSLEIDDYKSAHELSKKNKFFITLRSRSLKKVWREREVDSYELLVNNDPYKLILFHWQEMKRDTTNIVDYNFYGFETLMKSIQKNFTCDSYSEFLDQLLKNSIISSTSSQDAFMECKILGEKVRFYEPTLSRRIADDHIFCDTLSGYLHEPDNWNAHSVWVECDTIRNKLDAEIGIIEYKKIAKRSLLWWIKSKVDN